MSTENEFYRLLGLKLSGEASHDQLKALSEIMEDEPELHFLHDQLVNVSCEVPANDQIEAAFAVNCTSRIISTEEKEKYPPGLKKIKKLRSRLIYFAAASIAIIIGFAFWIYLNKETANQIERIVKTEEITTPNGIKSHLTLPDGTKVFINAGSTVEYRNFFNNGNREVTLTGEAFFEVTHDSTKPFIVHTKKADIKVLGTSFNVKSYPDEQFNASLIKGKIEVVLNNNKHERFVLKPLQSFVITEDKRGSERTNLSERIELVDIKEKNQIIPQTAWMDNKLLFTNASLGEIALEIERFYGTDIIFKNPATKEFKYTGVFENMSLEEIMELLSASRKLDFKITNNKVEIE